MGTGTDNLSRQERVFVSKASVDISTRSEPRASDNHSMQCHKPC